MSTTKRALKRLLQCGLPVPRFVRPAIRLVYRAGVAAVEGGTFLRKVFWVEPVIRSVCEAVGPRLRADRLPYIRGRGRIRIGGDVNLSGQSCFYFAGVEGYDPVISVGNHVFIGNRCTLSCAKEIRIGDHALISPGVRIHDNDGHPLEAGRRIAGEPVRAEEVAAVILEENVWIGAGAVILKGVRIGKNAVVGAGAVVARDVAADTVVGGNPAVELRKLG